MKPENRLILDGMTEEQIKNATYGDREFAQDAREYLANREYIIARLGATATEYYDNFDPREDGI